MKIFRRLLLPFSLVFQFITGVRNWLYNKGIFKSFLFNVPVIAIGNLSTGGTGKSPQAEYLIRLLKNDYRVATLSRGYKRKSKGFVLAGPGVTAEVLGDEPYQFHSKFTEVTVAVDADRVHGVQELLLKSPPPEVIILDDAYQHRRLKAGFYILLTAFNDLYTDDFVLPAGNLRESRSGAKRADVIVVTKCPSVLSIAEQQKIRAKLQHQPGQEVYFTAISYDDFVYSDSSKIDVAEIKSQKKILVAGIAKPSPFFNYLASEGDVIKSYPDHHDFTEKEITELQLLSKEAVIVTTEKDYVRLKGRLNSETLFYLPITTRFLNGGENFDQKIKQYVGKSTGNG